jgi:hypothetical protein
MSGEIEKVIPVYWICYQCGNKYGKPLSTFSTFHTGKCDVCKGKKSVTQGRDYGVYEIYKKYEPLGEQ